MFHHEKIALSLLLGAALLLPASAWAQAAASPPRQAPAPMTQPPQPRSINGITYLAGGIGEAEVAALRAQSAQYSAFIEFAEVEPGSQRGNWTADVAVDVKSGTQLLASIPVPGPLLLLRLAPGRYVLEATHADVKLTKTIEIKAKAPPLRERFVWRAAAGTLGNDLRK